MKVILEVEKGENLGTRYELSLHAYRAIGRAEGSADVTLQFTEEGIEVVPDPVVIGVRDCLGIRFRDRLRR